LDVPQPVFPNKWRLRHKVGSVFEEYFYAILCKFKPKTHFGTDTSYVDLSVATFDLAKASLSRFRSTHAIAVAAKDVHAKARAMPLGISLACEGAYLSACAQFEQGVRDLIDEAAIQAVGRKGTFALLPNLTVA